jgi:MYXO-CTERM domain-containing protein
MVGRSFGELDMTEVVVYVFGVCFVHGVVDWLLAFLGVGGGRRRRRRRDSV